MATQQINNHSFRHMQAQPSSQKKLDRFTNLAGEFLLEQWATVIAAFLGLLVFAALSVPFLSIRPFKCRSAATEKTDRPFRLWVWRVVEAAGVEPN